MTWRDAEELAQEYRRSLDQLKQSSDYHPEDKVRVLREVADRANEHADDQDAINDQMGVPDRVGEAEE